MIDHISLLKKEFEMAKDKNTDIHEHLEILKEYADQCESVTEFGVRDAMSTIAFLNSRAKLVSYEIVKRPRIDYIKNICGLEGRTWKFILKSSLEVSILETDFLFIDSLHTYDHLKKELYLHSHKAKRFIGFHDTKTYRDIGEDGSKGIWPAIEELLSEGVWEIVEERRNNNGLVIIGR